MTDQVVGKIMAVNSFELRHRPNINLGEMTVTRAAVQAVAPGDAIAQRRVTGETAVARRARLSQLVALRALAQPFLLPVRARERTGRHDLRARHALLVLGAPRHLERGDGRLHAPGARGDRSGRQAGPAPGPKTASPYCHAD